jgi:hypothetical protein
MPGLQGQIGDEVVEIGGVGAYGIGRRVLDRPQIIQVSLDRSAQLRPPAAGS